MIGPNPALLTVAIPTYNGARHIEQTVQSVLTQTELAFDLIVSDDRSTDDTLDRIRQVAGDRAQIEINSERLGLAGNWNRCVERTRTPFVNIFHQDDLMNPGHLATHLAAMGEGVGLVASGVEMVDEAGQAVPLSEVDPGGCGSVDLRLRAGTFLDQLAIANPLRCSAVTMRVEAYQQMGGFDSGLKYVVDWDAWIKLGRAWDLAWVATPTVAMRWHVASETQTFKTGTLDLEESIRLLSSLYLDHPDLSRFKSSAWKRLARAYLNRAYEAARSGQSNLCRHCLRRAVELSPRIVGTMIQDPRLIGRLMLGVFGGRG